MSDQDAPDPALYRQIQDRIRRTYPDFKGAFGKSDRIQAGEVRALGPMEPCERCGTDVVPMERRAGRRWYALAWTRPSGDGWFVQWMEHTPGRCAEAGR